MYEELVKLLRDYGRDCENGNEMCKNCTIQHFCENGWTPVAIADIVKIVLLFCLTVYLKKSFSVVFPAAESL